MFGTEELADLFGRATLELSQHATLRDSVDALRKRHQALIEQSGAPSPELRAMVMDFGGQLLAHFAVEEREEYFAALVEQSPELAEPIADLKREHREMEGLVGDLQRSTTTQQFVSALAQLLDRFALHERREAALLEKFFCEDHPLLKSAHKNG